MGRFQNRFLDRPGMDSASAVVEMKNAAPEAQQKVIGQQTQRSAFTRHHESLGVTRSHPELLRMTHVHGGTQQDCIFAMVTEWKTCVVCDDRPSGYHYGVMACEGCKAFFRRSISRSEAYKCIRKRLYAITKESRNRCQACRLNKCIAQGMSKAMLKGPTGKHERAAPTGCSDEARCGRVSDQRSYLSEAKENGVVVNG